jgi:serine/threonine protein kinase
MVCNHAVDDARPQWVAKIADFGGAIMDTHNEWLGGLRTPSQPWNAPDWMERMSLAGLMRTDIYSLGLVFWSIAANGVDPFKEYAEELGLQKPRMICQGFIGRSRRRSWMEMFCSRNWTCQGLEASVVMSTGELSSSCYH